MVAFNPAFSAYRSPVVSGPKKIAKPQFGANQNIKVVAITDNETEKLIYTSISETQKSNGIDLQVLDVSELKNNSDMSKILTGTDILLIDTQAKYEESNELQNAIKMFPEKTRFLVDWAVDARHYKPYKVIERTEALLPTNFSYTIQQLHKEINGES